MKILLIDDEKRLVSSLARALKQRGYLVDAAFTGEHGLENARALPYDLIVLDWGLEGRDGLSVLRELRARAVSCPILMLTARSLPEEKELALDAGADDFVCKPFALIELLARVRALLRRALAHQHTGQLRMGSLLIDEREAAAFLDGRRLPLTPIEFGVLRYLARRPGIAVSRMDLLLNVWRTDANATSNVVDVHVGSLRRKLSRGPIRVETARGVGYRLELTLAAAESPFGG